MNMLSDQWAPCLKSAVKVIALLAGLGAAATGLYAARLWYRASLIQLPAFDPPLASIDDAPALHILSVYNQLNETTLVLEGSSRLNASAARWTAAASILTGIAAVLGVV